MLELVDGHAGVRGLVCVVAILADRGQEGAGRVPVRIVAKKLVPRAIPPRNAHREVMDTGHIGGLPPSRPTAHPVLAGSLVGGIAAHLSARCFTSTSSQQPHAVRDLRAVRWAWASTRRCSSARRERFGPSRESFSQSA